MTRWKRLVGLLTAVLLLAGGRVVHAQTVGPVGAVQQTMEVNGYAITLDTTPATGDQGVMVQVLDSQGHVVPDAQVTVTFVMAGMQMPAVSSTAIPAVPGRYDGRGAFSMAGTWDVAVDIKLPGVATLAATFHVPVVDAVALPARPAPPSPPFWTPWTATSLSLLVVGLAAALATQLRRKSHRPLGFGVSFVLILAAAGSWLIPIATGAPSALGTNPTSTATRAAPVFKANCVPCHGATGQGDGPAARTLNPRPANLTAPHIDQHPDGQIYGWIHDGFPGSAMPSFGQRLTSNQIWDLVDYVRALRAATKRTAN